MGITVFFPDAEENEYTKKKKYIGAIVTVREAHYAGKYKVYFCLELGEYFSNTELKIIQSESTL